MSDSIDTDFQPVVPLFECQHCGSHLVLADVKESSLLAILQCHMCRATYHAELVMNEEKDYQIDATTLKAN